MTVTTLKNNLLQYHGFSIGAIDYEDIFHWCHNVFSIWAIIHTKVRLSKYEFFLPRHQSTFFLVFDQVPDQKILF